MQDKDTDLALTELFARFAEQLRYHSLRVQLLEETTHLAVTAHGNTSDALIGKLQNFDFLQQSLDDLAALADLIGARGCDIALPPKERRDLSTKLQMAQTKALLTQDQISLVKIETHPSGEPLIF